jgi:2'-5' RNA ligase
MSKIAVDIALIPPGDALEKIIQFNRELITDKQEIVLNKDSYLPHCTISMGVIESEKIPELWQKITSLANETKAIAFKANKIETYLRPDGRTKISGIDCEKTWELQNFHEKVMQLTKEYLTFDDVDLAMFVPSEFLTDAATGYIKGFWRKKSLQGYDPHITLGLGEPKDSSIDLDFQLSRLALCQCGAYTTCAKILLETRLQ